MLAPHALHILNSPRHTHSVYVLFAHRSLYSGMYLRNRKSDFFLNCQNHYKISLVDGGEDMKMYEYGFTSVMKEQEPSRQKFVAKSILKEVEKIAKERNISEEDAYFGYMHGLYGGDREIEE